MSPRTKAPLVRIFEEDRTASVGVFRFVVYEYEREEEVVPDIDETTIATIETVSQGNTTSVNLHGKSPSLQPPTVRSERRLREVLEQGRPKRVCSRTYISESDRKRISERKVSQKYEDRYCSQSRGEGKPEHRVDEREPAPESYLRWRMRTWRRPSAYMDTPPRRRCFCSPWPMPACSRLGVARSTRGRRRAS